MTAVPTPSTSPTTTPATDEPDDHPHRADRRRRRPVLAREDPRRGRHRQVRVRGRRAAAALGDDHEHRQEHLRAERRHRRRRSSRSRAARSSTGSRPTARSTRSTPRSRSPRARRSARACRSSGTARGRAPRPATAPARRCRRVAPRTTSACRSTASNRPSRSSSSCTRRLAARELRLPGCQGVAPPIAHAVPLDCRVRGDPRQQADPSARAVLVTLDPHDAPGQPASLVVACG